MRRRASIEKARQVLGYQPATDFVPRLRSTLDWFRRQRQQIEQTVRS